jgi:hypothetical protein
MRGPLPTEAMEADRKSPASIPPGGHLANPERRAIGALILGQHYAGLEAR